MLENKKNQIAASVLKTAKSNIAMAEPRAKRNRTSPDLKIRLDDGNIEVHAMILYLASPFFAGMLDALEAEMESQEKSIQLTGKTTEEFKIFYNSFQLATMKDLTPSTADVLTKYADEYRVEGLRAKCDNFLTTQAVDGKALQYAIKYKLEKRTKQCINHMLMDIERNVYELKAITASQKHLATFWPWICRKVGLSIEVRLPPAEHVESMWSFIAAAILENVERAKRLVIE